METIQKIIKTNASPNQVYQALTTQQGVQSWLTNNCKVGQKVGDPVILRFTKGGWVEGQFRVEKLEPNQIVIWNCIGNINTPEWQNTKVVFRLSPLPVGTQLTLEHQGFAGKTPGYEHCDMGWDILLKSLKDYLELGVGSPYFNDC